MTALDVVSFIVSGFIIGAGVALTAFGAICLWFLVVLLRKMKRKNNEIRLWEESRREP